MDAAGKDGAIRHVIPGSIRRGARSSASSIPVRRNSIMTFSGARTSRCRNAGASAFSIAPITRRS
ncbi:MAG: hypothetical protein U5L03_16550 [Burkholderiaceae bacterium]|nr:hypothetical protein [Burkholderiaceae bacterium]